MIRFSQFITEVLSLGKGIHLQHPEDLVISHGEEGFRHAVGSLKATQEKLTGQFNPSKLMTKFDGSVGMVFGHHPENGKFFVADRKSTRLNSSHLGISYAVFCLK